MPELIVHPNAAQGQDTYIRENTGDTHYGTDVFIEVGVFSTSNSTRRGLIKFDISSIPVGAEITNAYVQMRLAGQTNSVAIAIGIHRALTQWYEGNSTDVVPGAGVNASTWNNRNHNGSVNWGNNRAGGYDGIDWFNSASDFATVDTLGGVYTWDVTSDVQGFFAGTYTNHGWWLLGSQTLNRAKWFSSSDDPDSANTPRLVITYNIDTNLTPAASDGFGSTISPTVLVTESIEFTPTAVDAFGSTTTPTITALTDAYPVPIEAVGSTVNPSVVWGSLSIRPPASISVGSSVNPTVEWGDLEITAIVSTASETVIWGINQDRAILVGVAEAFAGTAGRHYVQHIDPEPCHNAPLLYITDGTIKSNGQLNRLDLLNPRIGIGLANWRPAITQYKQEGYWSNSPLGQGRRLARRNFDNAIEVLGLKAKGHDPDDLIEYVHELFSWQEAAADYEISDWSSRPVYLVARAAQEANARYAIIRMISIPELENPYSQPFAGRNGYSALENITARLERGHWLSAPPGQSECVAINNQQDWSFNTWVSLSNAPTGNVLTFVRATNGNLLAGTDDTAKIFVSTDEGLNWELLATLGTDPNDAVQQIILGHSGTLVAALTGVDVVKGVWKSVDNGDNWTRWVVPPTVASNQASIVKTLQPNAGAGIDSTISEYLPTRNYGTVSTISVGNDENNLARKGLIKFDLSAIPANSVILRARLTLYTWNEYSSTDYAVSMHRGLTQWFEGNEMGGREPQSGQDGSTWNLRNHNGSVAWAGGAGGAAGSDYATTATDSTSITGSGSFFTWDLEDDVQDWIDGTAPNYGWWMITNDVANSLKIFYSSDSVVGDSFRPQLLVEYAIPFTGIDGYYGVAYAATRQEYLATGGSAGSRGLISRTINFGGTNNFENWDHSTHTNGEIFKVVTVYDEALYGLPERFFISSSHVPGFNLVMSPLALFHGPPTQPYDFENVLPTMVTGASAIAANKSKTNGYVLIGTTDGKIYRANNKYTISTAYKTIQHIATLSGEITALYVAPPEDPGNTVYAAVGSDLYISTNGGYIWSLVTSYPATTIRALWQTSHTIITGISEGVDGYYLIGDYIMGQEDTCDAGVYIANKTTKANLTHIKRYDASLTIFEDLQFRIDPPYRLFPIPPAAGDIVYFGIASSDANSPNNPFSSLIFDILTPATDITTMVWEYWNGSAWTALTVQDNTDSFSTLGIESVHWMPPSNQDTTTVDGIEAWWVRLRVTVVGTDPIAPVVGNRYIYTPNHPYVDIAQEEVRGELPAVAQIKWKNKADDPGSSLNLQIDRMVCGLRSVSRGVNFNAYLNISDVQLPFGVSIAKDTDGTWTTATKTPTSRYLAVSHSSSGRLNAWNDLVTFTLSNTVARDYYGYYRAFLRVNKTGTGTSNWQLRIRTIFGSGGSKTDSKAVFVSPGVVTVGDWEVLDFGQISLPTVQVSQLSGNLSDELKLVIQGYNTTTNIGLSLYDLILIPIDEWAIDAQAPELSTTATTEVKSNGYLDIDSITNPKVAISALNRNSADQIISRYQAVNNGPAILQKEVQQRIWFFAMSYEDYWRGYPDISGTVQVYKQQQYLGFRGRN